MQGGPYRVPRLPQQLVEQLPELPAERGLGDSEHRPHYHLERDRLHARTDRERGPAPPFAYLAFGDLARDLFGVSDRLPVEAGRDDLAPLEVVWSAVEQ